MIVSSTFRRLYSVGAVVALVVGINVAISQEKGSQGKKGSSKMAGKVKADERTKNTGSVIVKKITEVEYAVLELQPATLVVTAIGEVPTGGYTKPLLTRAVYVTPPHDGIQDYFLTGVPPSGIATQVISPITAKNSWPRFEQEAPWLKGLRVHGVDTGVIEVKFP